MQFKSTEFQPIYHTTKQKTIRCFPCCCKPMHMDTSFCGYRIEVIVDAAAQYQYEDGDHVLGEFHSEHHPTLQLGDFEPTKQVQQQDFNVGKFSHIEGQHYCFILSAGRKWVLRESLLDKIYLHSKTLEFSVYLIQRGKVILQCTSPAFQVHLSKHSGSPRSQQQQQAMTTPKQQQQQEEAMKISPQQTGLSLLGMLAEVAETERTTAVPAATPTPRKRQKKRARETPPAAAAAAATAETTPPVQQPQLIEIGTPIPNFTLVVTPEWLRRYQIAQQNLPPPTDHDLNGIVYPDAPS